ncbi:hypothetical protein AB5J72_25245 [Streptomyces sp. CG1]|uniref:hypothetical protein n=1 Tax=Streptomyces sp. CG1 TaxID=1287523 RepID=UPI0034E21B2E
MTGTYGSARHLLRDATGGRCRPLGPRARHAGTPAAADGLVLTLLARLHQDVLSGSGVAWLIGFKGVARNDSTRSRSAW